MKNESVQKKLLAEKDLTLARAIEISVNMEAADQSCRSVLSCNEVSALWLRVIFAVARKGGMQIRESKSHKCGKVGHSSSLLDEEFLATTCTS